MVLRLEELKLCGSSIAPAVLKLNLAYPSKARKSSLGTEDQQWLEQDLRHDDTITLAVAAEEIREHTGAKEAMIPLSVHYILRP